MRGKEENSIPNMTYSPERIFGISSYFARMLWLWGPWTHNLCLATVCLMVSGDALSKEEVSSDDSVEGK